MKLFLTCFVAAAALAAAPASAQQISKPLAWLGMGFTWIDASPAHRAMKVQKVAAGGPAERGGLRAGDVITTVNQAAVDFGDDLDFLLFLEQRSPGESLTFGILRDGKPLHVPIVLGAMPEVSRPKWQQALEMARRRRLEAESARTARH